MRLVVLAALAVSMALKAAPVEMDVARAMAASLEHKRASLAAHSSLRQQQVARAAGTAAPVLHSCAVSADASVGQKHLQRVLLPAEHALGPQPCQTALAAHCTLEQMAGAMAAAEAMAAEAVAVAAAAAAAAAAAMAAMEVAQQALVRCSLPCLQLTAHVSWAAFAL